jgi:cell division protein FtsL
MRDTFDLKLSNKNKSDKDFSNDIKKLLSKERFYEVKITLYFFFIYLYKEF